MIIGLTGGIATGKSTVSKLFRQCGAMIVDADHIAREVVEPGTVGSNRVRVYFGSEVFREDGTLDRKALGQLVFNDQAKRQRLEQILHPLVRIQLRRQTEDYLAFHPESVVIWDVPLLYESRLTPFVEKVIVVYIPEEIQLKRLMQRDSLSQQEAKKRMDSQISIEDKRTWADYVIDNRDSYKNTERQVKQLWKSLNSRNG